MPCAPDCGAGGRLVDADHPAVVVDQRAARVAGVDRGRGLEQAAEELQLAAVVLDRLVAVEARDDADRDRALQRERLADGDRPLAGLEPAAVGELDRRRQLGVAVDLDQGQVGARVGGVDVALDPVAVVEDDGDRRGALGHDVGVGDDQAVARVDEARARGALLDPLAIDRPPPPPKNCESGSAGTSRVPLTMTWSATTDGSTRLTALMMRSWSVVPPLVSGGGVDGRRRVARPGDSREMRARVEHHRETSDDRADQPHDRGPEDTARLHDGLLLLGDW